MTFFDTAEVYGLFANEERPTLALSSRIWRSLAKALDDFELKFRNDPRGLPGRR